MVSRLVRRPRCRLARPTCTAQHAARNLPFSTDGDNGRPRLDANDGQVLAALMVDHDKHRAAALCGGLENARRLLHIADESDRVRTVAECVDLQIARYRRADCQLPTKCSSSTSERRTSPAARGIANRAMEQMTALVFRHFHRRLKRALEQDAA
jgi:hypothetical protein